MLADRFHDNHGSLVVLSDMDISGQGKYTSKRRGYQTLLEAIRSGKATAVYSYSLSRLARSVAELDRFFALCQEHKVPVRLVADAVDTSTASGRLTANVLASVAQFEAEVTGERVKARIALKQANGERVGAPPYGQKAGEDHAAVVSAFEEAGSFRGAARILNEQGIPTRQGGPWGTSSVSAVIRKHDPTIPALKRGVRARGSFMLSRLLVCGTCGTVLTGTRQIDRRKEPNVTRVVYECHRGHDIPHPKRSVHENVILPAIKALAAQWQPPHATEEEIAGDRVRQAELEAKRLRILDLYADGEIDKQEREQRLQPVNAALAAMQTYRVMWAVPSLDWDWPPQEVNRVLRAMFLRIELNPVTYQPADFDWVGDVSAVVEALNLGVRTDAITGG